MADGSYQHGLPLSPLVFDDGTAVYPPPQRTPVAAVSSPGIINEELHLAPDTAGLPHPIFHTTGCGIGLGAVFNDLADIKRMTGDGSTPSVQATANIEIPLGSDPAISLLGNVGFGLAGGGQMNMCSISLILRPGHWKVIKPIVGLGFGYTSYNYSEKVIIDASVSYALLTVGLNIVPDQLDILFTYPLTKGQRTLFEENSYSIDPAGMGVSLLISL